MLDAVRSGYERSVDELVKTIIVGVIVGVGVGVGWGVDSGVVDLVGGADKNTFELDYKCNIQ